MLGSTAVVLGQEEPADEGPSRYLYGTAEGMMQLDMENPAGCIIGFTSVTTLTGESTLLGATTIELTNCLVEGNTFQNIHDGVITLTGEKGAALSGTATGHCIPD
jgi:hypothetical protein